MGLGAAALFHFKIIDRGSVRLLAWLTLLLILASGAIGGYQAGFEWHWWHGPSSCTGPRFQLSAHMDLNAPVVSCENPSWRLFGLSLAGYNFLISGGVALLGALLLLRVIKLPLKWANS